MNTTIIIGPIGTGKTFIAETLAASLGKPITVTTQEQFDAALKHQQNTHGIIVCDGLTPIITSVLGRTFYTIHTDRRRV